MLPPNNKYYPHITDLMGRLKPDSRRRITLPKEMVKKNQEFIAAKLPDGTIILHPIQKDPLKSLQEEGKKLPKDKSIRELRKEAEELAIEEALNDLRRH